MKPNYRNFNKNITILAGLIGLLTGVISIVFNQFMSYMFNILEPYFNNTIIIIVVPIGAALIVGFIRMLLLKVNNQGFGVSQVMYEIEHIETKTMKPLGEFYKLLGTLATLLAGFSAGRQGPLVHIGGAVGSNVAYSFKTEDEHTRVLIGCGVAGCLAGVYNSPIFATLFVVEILFKKRYFDMIPTIMLSALSSTFFVKLFNDRHFLGSFQVEYEYVLSEIPYFIFLGILAGLIASLYVFSLRYANRFFQKLKWSLIVKNLIGSAAIILSLSLLKDVYFYNLTPTKLLAIELDGSMFLLIALTYIVLTSITIASGGFGGIFAPGLIIGLTSALGIGKLIIALGFPLTDLKTFAIAGMAALYAGFAVAPLSGSIMIVELTGQYDLLFPVLITTLVASQVAQLIIHHSIYHHNLYDLLSKD
jgi:CIC family chloride channel protein